MLFKALCRSVLRAIAAIIFKDVLAGARGLAGPTTDGTITWTSPTGHTYTTDPGSNPQLCQPTARHTRAADTAKAKAAERLSSGARPWARPPYA
jgi:hypothetical protein